MDNQVVPEPGPRRNRLLQPESISWVELIIIRIFLLTKLISELVSMGLQLHWG